MDLNQPEVTESNDFICEACHNKIIFGKGHKADCSTLKNLGFKNMLNSTLKKNEEAIEEAVVENKPEALFEQGRKSLKELKQSQAKLQGAILYNTTMNMLNRKQELTPEELEQHKKKVELKKQIKLLKKSKGKAEDIKKLKKEMLKLVVKK